MPKSEYMARGVFVALGVCQYKNHTKRKRIDRMIEIMGSGLNI